MLKKEKHIGEQTTFEKLGIPYEERDGLLYPILSSRKPLQNVGKYGLLWLRYMQENEAERYRNLIRFERAEEKACEVNEEAYAMLETIMHQQLRKHNKPRDSSSTMEMWKLREQAKAQAEEVVLHDIVYQFH